MPLNRTPLTAPAALETPAAIIPFGDHEVLLASRMVPVEVPVNIVYSGIPFAVMMMTPSDLEDFAVGFSLTEGVIDKPADVRSIRLATEERGIRLEVDLMADRLHWHLARRRAMAGRTGCGVCGIDDLEALPKARSPAGSAPTVSVQAIRAALDGLRGKQPLNCLTGAMHAAAWADLDGTIAMAREDVGRHNALDKLIGALCREGGQPEQGFVIVTSRCSFELVEKAASFGARTLVAISAPTSLALERARLHDITLIGIARQDTMTVFHGLERVRGQEVVA
ncbi:formate dehydrogenase accessory sulfurtransferase FdhD [Microvirga sp. VF16]|uniref:formate dehydrogenase accessory sulfurtransferase FdhD n=1 Tax=Microvirga sp. VF16 TaxID=2807101 RepID=UPI00193EA00E|nr:formate dehydrogenase accessory sulfurtransferase FdhD [Microvirga sp. VF16]QRM35718.1 formate dehydrogenase accessory sulfurtransferase FdhD [Microvirga sp. VF16]